MSERAMAENFEFLRGEQISPVGQNGFEVDRATALFNNGRGSGPGGDNSRGNRGNGGDNGSDDNNGRDDWADDVGEGTDRGGSGRGNSGQDSSGENDTITEVVAVEMTGESGVTVGVGGILREIHGK